MSQELIEDYIEKIILLEKRVGEKTGYQLFEPFSLNPGNVIEIQAAARGIAEFIGLHDFTFIIAPVKQEEHVGGHVELRYGEKEVFVEVSDDTLRFESSLLATLAHEITHKYLHVNGVYYGYDIYENEILTDIATVFLGLGKLMLNGCECQDVYEKYVIEGKAKVAETLKVGYLNRSQFAFVYRFVCAMRRIPSSDYERGLSSDSIKALRECERRYGYYFDNRFHEADVRERLVECLRSAISDTQLNLAIIDKNLLYFQKACIKTVESFLEKTHKRIHELIVELQNIADDEYDPCLRYINAIQLDQKIEKLVSEVKEYSSEVNKYKNRVAKLAGLVQKFGDPFPKPSSGMFTIVTCRNDGTKLELPADKDRLVAKCPRCQYRFIADTSTKLNDNKNGSLLKRIFRVLFRGK